MEVFIGSSRESLPTVREIEAWVVEAGHEPLAWDKPGLFMPGDHAFETLIGISRRVGAAILVFSPDDALWYRGDIVLQPRDNVLIEYGLLAGALGRKKAIICRDGEARSASDVAGLTYIDVRKERRPRARVELMIWAQRLESTPIDPEVARLHARVAEAERERRSLVDQLSFETEKSKELITVLTQRKVVDFARYDLGSDGLWKLLFDYGFVGEVSGILADAVATPVGLRAMLRNAKLDAIADRIEWSSTGDPDRSADDNNPQRRLVFARKVLRVFRLSWKWEPFVAFIASLSAAENHRIMQAALAAVTRLSATAANTARDS
jgi:hypothetical protein